MLLVGVGLNSSGDPGRGSSCWGLVLLREVELLVGLSFNYIGAVCVGTISHAVTSVSYLKLLLNRQRCSQSAKFKLEYKSK